MAFPMQQLAAFLQAEPPSASRAGTPDSIADRLDELAHANAKAVGQAVLMMNDLAQTATSLLQFAAELSACTRARVPAAGPAAGMPAAAAAAVLQPPPAEVAPAADARSPSKTAGYASHDQYLLRRASPGRGRPDRTHLVFQPAPGRPAARPARAR